MDNKDESIEYIQRQILALPCDLQRACCWLIANINLVEELSAGEKFTQSKFETYVKKAKQKNDDIMLILVLYKHFKDQYGV